MNNSYFFSKENPPITYLWRNSPGPDAILNEYRVVIHCYFITILNEVELNNKKLLHFFWKCYCLSKSPFYYNVYHLSENDDFGIIIIDTIDNNLKGKIKSKSYIRIA